jgi:hypothetical protein
LYFEGSQHCVINNPKITTGDLTIEFWMKWNHATAASIIAQEAVLNISLNNGEMSFL